MSATPGARVRIVLLISLVIATARGAGAEGLVGADGWDSGPAVHPIDIELGAAEVEALHRNPRGYVRATVRADGHVYREVGVHLKGATGSFRPLEDKPSLTLNFGRSASPQRFQGRRKVHLNNSVEDPSYVNEQVASEVFRAAGIPAPEVSHALVTLNGRRLGLYVLKEGFTDEFLGRSFPRGDGPLYEPERGQDVDGRMILHSGDATPGVNGGLEKLAAAVLETDVDRRWRRLEEVLDIDRFLTLMVLEVILCHRDGYCLARNNFRLYQEPDTGKFTFLPSGMDQLFGPANLPWKPQMSGLVARAIMDTPEGRRRYEQRFASWFATRFDSNALTNRVTELTARLQPALSAGESSELERAAGELRTRIVRRGVELQAQLLEPQPQRLDSQNRIASVAGWKDVDPPAGGRMEVTTGPEACSWLHIVAGPVTSASWRARPVLPFGRYRFEGRVRTSGVKPLPFGQHQGAALRAAGQLASSAGLIGDAPWTLLSVEFEVGAADGEVELVCELRASAGEAWFEENSLRLSKIR